MIWFSKRNYQRDYLGDPLNMKICAKCEGPAYNNLRAPVLSVS